MTGIYVFNIIASGQDTQNQLLLLATKPQEFCRPTSPDHGTGTVRQTIKLLADRPLQWRKHTTRSQLGHWIIFQISCFNRDKPWDNMRPHFPSATVGIGP